MWKTLTCKVLLSHWDVIEAVAVKPSQTMFSTLTMSSLLSAMILATAEDLGSEESSRDFALLFLTCLPISDATWFLPA